MTERTIKDVKKERNEALRQLRIQKKEEKLKDKDSKPNYVIKNSKKRKKLKILTISCCVMDLIAIIGFFIMYGPIDKFRNLYVTTAMKTMTHHYLANIFYSDKQIEKIMSSNYFVAIDDDANVDDIVIDTKEKTSYSNKYEKELLTRDPGNDLYKIINLKVGDSNAYLVAIYDPTKVQLISMQRFGGTQGERVITMCQRYGGIICINGGGFEDQGYGSGIPLGYVIEDGKITWPNQASTTKGNIIGMTSEGKLLLLNNVTGEEAINKGVVDGLEFGPFLIVNGKSMKIVGDPWGKAPRVAIAQRKDGVMMFLAVDGQNYINGASLQNMIDTLQLYGAYNAANLDGGQSATLVVNNKLFNNPPASAKSTNGRYVVTGWGLIP